MFKEPIIHSVGKSRITRLDQPRVIVALSVYSIDIEVQKKGLPVTASNKYHAHATFVSEKFEVYKDEVDRENDYTDCSYKVDVQFKDKQGQKVFKLLSSFCLTQGTLLIDKECTYFEAQNALFEIFAHMDINPCTVTYSKD